MSRCPSMPAGTDRLFPHHRLEEVLDSPDFLIPRLLEDGDAEDLRWMFNHLPADSIRDWFAARAHRQLSRRSRAFWTMVLDQQPGIDTTAGGELWPL